MNLVNGFQQLATAPEGVNRIRELILSLAVQGRLVRQNALDEPATVLLDRIAVEKQKQVLNEKGRRRALGLPSDRPAEASDLPDGWAWTSLSEIGVISPRNNTDDNVRVSFVQMSSIPAALAVPHAVEERSWSEVKSGFTHFAEGDVGVAKITPCFENGKSTVFRNLTNGIGAGTTELHVVRPLGGVRPEYVLIFLKTPQFLRNGERVMTGSAGQKRLPRQYFESVPFPLPPLPEQARIVAKVDELMRLCDEMEACGRLEEDQHTRLVSTLFDVLAASESPHELAENWDRVSEHFDLLLDRPEAADALEQAVLQLAVRGLLVPQDASDESADELLGRIREEKDRLIAEGKIKRDKSLSPIDENAMSFDLPKGWAWARLAQLGEKFDYGTSQRTGDGAGVPVLRMGNIQRGEVIFDSLKYLNDQCGELPELYLREGDLLFNRTNSYELVGKTGLFLGDSNRFSFASYLIRVRLMPELTNPRYVNLYMNSIECRRTQIEPQIVQQNGQANFNGTKLQHICVPLPPLAEQARIVARVEKLRAFCRDLHGRLIERQVCQSRFAAALVEQSLLADSLCDERGAIEAT